jgi:exodeoxyribonuclease VII large subunit
MTKPSTVSELNAQIRSALKNNFKKTVQVIGEVSNLKTPKHYYFSLKDDKSIISVMIWNANSLGLPKFTNGQKIVVDGYIDTYSTNGSYQLVGRDVQIVGTGDLQKEVARMKEECEQKGYFNPKFKKKIPQRIRTVGVLTSSDGAALQDFLYVLNNNKFFGKIYIKNCAVQGKDCPKSVVSGIKQLDKMNLDIIVVTRGGGSIEDLFGFSHQDVVEAIFKTNTPVISAIGHEIDTMLSDLVADIRAPTPSIAGEIISMSQKEEIDILINQKLVQNNYVKILKKLTEAKDQLSLLQRRLVSPKDILGRYANDIERMLEKSTTVTKHKLVENKTSCDQLLERIKMAHPHQLLNRGYCLLTDTNDNFINSVDEIEFVHAASQKLKIRLKDGYLLINLENIQEFRDE